MQIAGNFIRCIYTTVFKKKVNSMHFHSMYLTIFYFSPVNLGELNVKCFFEWGTKMFVFNLEMSTWIMLGGT